MVSHLVAAGNERCQAHFRDTAFAVIQRDVQPLAGLLDIDVQHVAALAKYCAVGVGHGREVSRVDEVLADRDTVGLGASPCSPPDGSVLAVDTELD